MRNTPSLEDKLAALGKLRNDAASPQAQKELAKYLGARISLLVAKAAKIAGDARLSDLIPQLIDAFGRFMVHPETSDKGCAAKLEIARALLALEHTSPDVFLRAIRHVQMEPSWATSIDTAAGLRGTAALGLAQTGYHDTGVELVRLLADREREARIGAVRALAWWGGSEAELLLRYKALIGDEDAVVTSECFSGLLRLAPERSLDFVASYLDHEDEAIAEGAALALGESKLEAAFALLKNKIRSPIRRAVLLAIAMLRKDEAIEYVASLAAEGNKDAEAALEMMAANKRE
jgi:HEAT repeat protein